ncbi:hypothetical protein SAMN06295885_0291 [Rathayibacter oskolensis]|uniref:Uncharacterized protein n=1 Tax=Rathayibacter oskolensis TaxID=1891671 RepID=A0A1X7MZ45_9MICO|nr:hypothetical protein SAMN06295885_0291 [Rathayibacter oskolensis]
MTVLPDRLELRLTAAERLLALHRGDVVIDRANIRSATVTEDPWIWVRGIRAPGTAIPLTIAAGTWKFHGGKDFLLIKRTAVAVVIDLADEDYARLIISTKHAPELLAALQLGTATAAIPVIETDDLVIVPEVAEQAAARMAAATASPEEASAAEESTEEPSTESAGPEEPITEAASPAEPSPAPAEPAQPETTAPVAPAQPAKRPSKPRTRAPRADSSVGHASAEPSGATEAAE